MDDSINMKESYEYFIILRFDTNKAYLKLPDLKVKELGDIDKVYGTNTTFYCAPYRAYFNTETVVGSYGIYYYKEPGKYYQVYYPNKEVLTTVSAGAVGVYGYDSSLNNSY